MTTHQATLPIDDKDGLSMDATEAARLGSLFVDDYNNADPFPHIVIDNFLPDSVIRSIAQSFPEERAASDIVFNIGYGGEHKRQIMPEDCNATARAFFQFMNSRPVLQFLEGLTGIQALLPDPYFVGGGFHEISRGGKLGVHTDFRINEQLHLQRRLNLLIYLNETWDDAWRGQLELWTPDMKECRTKVAPLWNRCVVFNTDDQSWHGHPDELLVPDGVKRRSIALYYYTASKGIYAEVPNLSTMYRERPGDTAAVRDEARSFRTEQYLRQWTPPVLWRTVYRIHQRLRRG